MKKIIPLCLILLLITMLCSCDMVSSVFDSMFGAKDQQEQELFLYELNEDGKSYSVVAYFGQQANVIIPDTYNGLPVTSIGRGAFRSCSWLYKVEMSSSVTSIGDEAFAECVSLSSITFPNSLTSIGNEAFAGCAVLSNVTFPNSLISIGNRAFFGCESFTDVSIPSSVISIGELAFWGCSALINVDIVGNPETTFGEYVFLQCISLENVTIGDSITNMGVGMFSGCTSLTDAPIGKNVKSISESAFADCSSLKNIIIPDSVTSIEEYAFINCESIENITIPVSVTKIHREAFDAYNAEASICFEGDILDWFNIDLGENGLLARGIKLYFKNVLVTEVTIPDTVKKIPDYAFMGYEFLEKVTISGSVTEIGNYAFYECCALVEMNMPTSVISIGESAFLFCYDLEINYAGTREQWLQIEGCRNVYSGVNVNMHEHWYTEKVIPPSCLELGYTIYTCSCGESYIANYVSATGHNYGEWIVAKEATLTEEGLLERYCACGEKSERIIAPSSQGFEFELNGDKKSCTLVSMGNCTDTVLIIPTEYMGLPVTHISGSAFKNQTSITGVVIPDTVVSFGSAFYGCSSLESIVIPYGVTKIAPYAFEYCTALTSVTIPNSVTSIGDRAFYFCWNLSSITISNNVTTIGNKAFDGCNALTEIIIPDGVISIGAGAFGQSLKKVVLPDSITNLDPNALSGCTSLEDIYYTGSQQQWEAYFLQPYEINYATVHYNYVPKN